MKSPILLSLLTAGFLAAQATPPAQTAPATQQTMKFHHRVAKGQRMARLTRQLNLTPDQQKQARSIFADARAQRQQLHANTMAKFGSILTPDQKAKFDAMKAKRQQNS
jgi:Spy/CpxP family protein refolding chaperone